MSEGELKLCTFSFYPLLFPFSLICPHKPRKEQFLLLAALVSRKKIKMSPSHHFRVPFFFLLVGGVCILKNGGCRAQVKVEYSGDGGRGSYGGGSHGGDNSGRDGGGNGSSDESRVTTQCQQCCYSTSSCMHVMAVVVKVIMNDNGGLDSDSTCCRGGMKW